MFTPLQGLVGSQPPTDIWVPTTTANFALGTQQNMVDEYWGWGNFVYAKAAQACEVGRLCYLGLAYAATDIPDTANTGFPVVSARAAMDINTYGWFQTAGYAPWFTAASVAAGVAVGIGAAGKAGTNGAGKQILGARVNLASTGTIVKLATATQNGSPIIRLGNISGLFVGLAASGTGIAASTIIAMNPNQNEVTLSANCTASGSVTATFTFTGYLGVMFNAAHIQGAIT